MGLSKFKRHSARVIQSRRWPALRLQAKRRDGFRCVGCGARGRLEVDHVQPVRTHPELAFDLSNLQTLCVSCHSRKTRIECGLGSHDPGREKWKELVRDIAQNKTGEKQQCLCL